MLITLKRVFVLQLFMLFTGAGLGGVYAHASTTTPKPEEVVKAYLKLDAEGGILVEGKRKIMQGLYPDLSEVHYSERTSVIFLIAGYRVLSVKNLKDEVRVSVEYDVIGEVEDHKIFRSRQKIERLGIGLRKIDGKWYIVTDLWHHISWQSFIAYLQDEQERLGQLRPQVEPHYQPDMYGDLIEKITKSINIKHEDNRKSIR